MPIRRTGKKGTLGSHDKEGSLVLAVDYMTKEVKFVCHPAVTH